MMIQLDIIEMQDVKIDKKRSMVSINVIPHGAQSVEARKIREYQIRQMCKVDDNESNLDETYSKLNEKFINEIID